MKTKIGLVLPAIAVLSGCMTPLKPTTDVSKYFIVPGTTFVSTQLCGIHSGAESCIRMQNGAAVKSVIKSDFRSWVNHLDKSDQITTQAGKTAIVLDKDVGSALIQSLAIDNRERELIRMQRYNDRDDR
jgi:hypothetical protein